MTMGPDPPIRVAIIDGLRMFAESIGRILNLEGDIEVQGLAFTSHSGVELVEATSPNVAILDFRLADDDGAQTTKRILTSNPQTKVLVLTGYADKRMLGSAIRSGCSGFLTKDRAIDELPIAIRATHYGEAYLPSQALARLTRTLSPETGVGGDLTRRERIVLQLLSNGMSSRDIANQLTLSLHTVRNHVQRILTKLGAHSKLEAVTLAFREDLVERTGND
jgi:DNA-binding NarL/FixJ family response regulator